MQRNFQEIPSSIPKNSLCQDECFQLILNLIGDPEQKSSMHLAPMKSSSVDTQAEVIEKKSNQSVDLFV